MKNLLHNASYYGKGIDFSWKRILLNLCLIAISLPLLVSNVSAQEYIQAAGVLGSDLNEGSVSTAVRGDTLYVYGTTYGPNFPTTDGSIHQGSGDVFFAKYDGCTLNLLESRIYGSSSSEYSQEIIISGNYAYTYGSTQGPGFPVTNGSSYSGNSDMYIKTLDLDGNIVAAGYFGGSGYDYVYEMEVVNGVAHVVIGTQSGDFPTTNGSSLQGTQDVIYMQVDLLSLNILYSTYIGGNNIDSGPGIEIENGKVYIGFYTTSSNLPVTTSTSFLGLSDAAVAVYDQSTGALQLMTYLGGTQEDEFNAIHVENGIVTVVGNSASSDFPTTSGGPASSLPSMYFTVLDNSLNITSSKFLDGAYLLEANLIDHEDAFYFSAYQIGLVTPGGIKMDIYKVDKYGNVIWIYDALDVLQEGTGLSVYGGKVYSVIAAGDPTLPTTNGSYLNGDYDMYLTVLDTLAANLIFSGYYGGPGSDYNIGNRAGEGPIVYGSKIYMTGHGTNGFPTTNGSAGNNTNNESDIALLVLETCPVDYEGNPNPSPPSQSVCIGGLTTEIEIDPYIVPSTSLPVLTSNGTTYTQADVHAHYQWQEAPSAGGPWTNIPGAISDNYTPPPLATATCYRRQARKDYCCGPAVIQTTNVHCVAVGPDVAPIVDAGGIYNTCPGTSITMNASVTGGLPSYQYAWALGNSSTILSTTPVLTVNPTSTGGFIYTVTVTDANGCRQIDQAIVNAYSANAGPDVSFCEGTNGAVIGAPAIPGLSGVVYSWSPSLFLSCTNCAQPTATPNFLTTYTLTMTVPVTGGGTCTTTDQVVVRPVSKPINNFAGPDKVICYGNTTTVGLNAQPGFDYTWSPGSYLTDNLSMPTTFDHGNLSYPFPNAITYQVTAEKDGCTWYDDVEVAVIRAKAYPGNLDPACGPRYVGTGDFTPNINETWQWTQLSGDGMFTGPTNVPVTTVSASPTQTSQYQLSVSYNGTVCTDVATVPPCGGPGGGGGCEVEIYVGGNIGCPSYGSYGEVWLIAYGGAGGSTGPFTFTWSPAAGLNTTVGDSVMLTDNVPRTYTVTMTSVLDPTLSCTESISVNNPAWSKPDFDAQDPTICPGQPVNIGEPPVAGYAYSWTPITNLSNPMISNPIATVNANTTYYVEVEDIGSGCIARDTATITVVNSAANAGPDRLICSNGVVKLGSPQIPNTTYSWTPAGANWQNGTNQFSAQPEVLVAINTTFTLTTTNTLTGCTDTDVVLVTIGTPVPNFNLPNLNYCPSGLSVQLGNGTPGGFGYTYTWSPGSLLNNPNAQFPTVIQPLPTTPTTFTVIVKNASGCSNFATQTITPTVSAPQTAPNQVVCVGEMVSIGSNNNPTGPGISYSWSPTTGLSNPFSPNPVFTATSTGLYTYTVTMNQGNCSNTSSVTINVIKFEISLPPKTICEGGCTQIGTSAIPGATYSWTPTIGLDDPSSSNPIACVTANTVYTLTVISPNGCQAVTTVPVYVNSSPAPQVVIPTLNACIGTTGNFLVPTVNPPGNYTYNWAPNNGTLIYTNSPSPEVVIGGLGTFTYYVTVTNVVSGCATESSVNVVVTTCEDPCGLQASTVANNLKCYNDNSGSIDLTVTNSSPPNTYNWSNGAVVEDPSGLSAGVYVVTITDADGCSIMKSVTLTEPTDVQCATSVLSDVTVFGGNDGSALAVGNGGTPGYMYQWSSGQNTSIATGLMAGTYTISIYDNNGCLETCTVTITQPPGAACEPCYDAEINDLDICVEIAGDPNHPLASLDCDEGGVINITECFNGGDPMEPSDDCDIAIVAGENICLLINGDPDHPMAYLDCDNGGVPNWYECLNFGDPSDPVDDCSVAKTGALNICVFIGYSPNHPLSTLDCDNGGVDNYTECVNGLDACDPNDDCTAAVRADIDMCAIINGDPNHPWASLDCDRGGIINITECNNGADPNEPSDDLYCPPNLCAEAIEGSLDICDELDTDPNHPIGTLDCDGDGVSNEDECDDGTDPLDPCDYEDTSITLPVTADQSGCPVPCPDLTPVVTILPGNIAGNSPVEVAVEVSEIDSMDTNGSIITVRMPSDPRLLFVWNIGLTQAALVPVQNPDWNYLGDNGIVHTWTYNGPGLIINAKTTSAFGFQAFYDPQATDGQTTVTATILPYGGGECNILNNTDSERLVYFQ